MVTLGPDRLLKYDFFVILTEADFVLRFELGLLRRLGDVSLASLATAKRRREMAVRLGKCLPGGPATGQIFHNLFAAKAARKGASKRMLSGQAGAGLGLLRAV
jgi:hypothetical protein